MEKVICNIFEIGTLKNFHFDTNVAVLTEAFVNVWTKFVLADVIFFKWPIRRSTKVKNRLFTYLYFDHKISSPGRIGHEI